jgi:hypothetical protein
VSGDNGNQYRVIVSATGGASSVTSSAATLTVSSGPAFSAVSWRGNYYTSTFSASGSTITVNDVNASNLQFTMPTATLTGTRTGGNGAVCYLSLNSSTQFTGSYLQKDGTYAREITYAAVSGSISNVPAGTYWVSFGRPDYSTPAQFTLVLS